MASKDQVESWTEEVICPICLDFFTDPVALECGHNFCRSCITQSWDSDGKNSCPECREKFVHRILRVSRALARLSDKARTLSLNREEKESKCLCEIHQEEVKLFCETDKTLMCVICAAGQEHVKHRFMQIEEAVEIYKDQVKSSFESLTKKILEIQQIQQQQKRKISEVLEQSQNLQLKIKFQFAELQQILTKKEQRVLADIREDEKRIVNKMEENVRGIQENLNLIQEELAKLQEQMDQKDSVIFLKEEVGRKKRVSDKFKTLAVTDGALQMKTFDHHFLMNTLWREIYAIKRVSVTLDVETAHAQLDVSEDRKSVRCTGTKRSLPDTGKRFTYRKCVLGLEGFTSGRHYWDVEVAGSRYWSLGVATESVERKERVTLTLESGASGGDGVTSLMHSHPLHPLSPPVPSPGGWEFISVTSLEQFHFTMPTPSPISTPSLGINSRRNFILSSGLGM